MGLEYHVTEALIRERKHRTLAGDVVLIGRQTVYFSPRQLLELLRSHGINVDSVKPGAIELDHSTVNRRQSHADSDLVTDAALFRLLDVPKILALDHSDYEGAEIIHDLNKPVPEALKNRADFIVDGSTLDNTFNAALTLKNFADLLRPGGRLITMNMYSNHHLPYSIPTPLWYLDYFVANGFADCKVYILVHAQGATGDPQSKEVDVFCINLQQLADPSLPPGTVGNLSSPHIMATIVFAEKGQHSTTDISPIQQHYRSARDWVVYRENLSVIMQSPRPHLVRSLDDIAYADVTGGHLFVASDFSARDPMTEILKRRNRAATHEQR